MARPREFDVDHALKGAMEVFWEHGYDGASMPDLLSGMGITRGSLYKAFTDKRTLFMTVLERYEAQEVTPVAALLRGDDPTNDLADGLARIAHVFNAVTDAVRAKDYRGCLFCSAAAGPASEDRDIAEIVDDLLSQMHEGFSAALRASPKFHARSDTEIGDLANLLNTQYVGLRILARSQISVPRIESSVAAVIGLLVASEG